MDSLINAANIIYSTYIKLIDQIGITGFIHLVLNICCFAACVAFILAFVILMDHSFSVKFHYFTLTTVVILISLMWMLPLIDCSKMAWLPVFLLAQCGVLRLMIHFIKEKYIQVVDIKYIKYQKVDAIPIKKIRRSL